MITTTTRIAVLYLRLSDIRAEDLDANGVERTFALREQAMRERAVALGWTVAHVIRENDVPGKDGRMRSASAFKRKRIVLSNGDVIWRVVRKGFTELLRLIKAGEVNAALCEDLDRLMRDPYDNEDLMQVAKLHRTTVTSLSGSLQITNGGNDGERLAARILVATAAKSSEDTSRRVADGRHRKAQRGEWGGGLRPFGFRVVDKCLELEPEEAKIIREYTRRLLRNEPPSMKELAAELRTKGVPTVNGGKWNPQTLRQMLLRPRNAGLEVYQGQEIGKTSHPPIVPETLYRQLVRVLTDPARRKNPGGREPRWLGSGIYTCGECGGTMYVSQSGKKRNPRYICKTYNHVGRLVSHVDITVTAALFAYVGEQRAWPAKIRRVAGPTTDLGELNAERDAARRKLDELAEDYAADLIDRAQLRAGTERGKARIAALDAQIREHFAHDSAVAALLGAEDVEQVWNTMPLAEQRATVRELLTVTIHRARSMGQTSDPEALTVRLRSAEEMLVDHVEMAQMEQREGTVVGAA